MEQSLKKRLYQSKFYLLCLLLLVLAAFVASCGQERFQSVPSKVTDFRAKLIEGGISSYQAVKGKATFIVLTASWCPGCRAEIPYLKKLHSEFADKGFKILMVSEDDSPQIAANYNKAAGITWTTFHWNYDLMNALGNPGVIPVTYLVNEQDSIVKINVGGFDEKEIRTLLKRLLTQSRSGKESRP